MKREIFVGSALLAVVALAAGQARADIAPASFVGYCLFGEQNNPRTMIGDTLGECAKTRCGVTEANDTGWTACTMSSNNGTVSMCVDLSTTTPVNVVCTCSENDTAGNCTNEWMGSTLVVGGNATFGPITFVGGFMVSAQRRYKMTGQQCPAARFVPPKGTGAGSWVAKDVTVTSDIRIMSNAMITFTAPGVNGQQMVALNCKNSGNIKRARQMASTNCIEQ